MKRSKFNLSNTQLLTADMGNLLPIGLLEVLPGDTIQHATSLLVRAMPLQSPPMHRVRMKIHHWYVPHRIIWEDWEDFITGGPDGNNSSVFPTLGVTSVAEKSLADYLGVPVGTYNANISALPFRAYALIFNEWYRDQDLVTPLTIDLTSGTDTTTNQTLQNVAWEKDYFTTARPWEQKGPAVTLPLGTTAPVNLNADGATTAFIRALDGSAIAPGADSPMEARAATGVFQDSGGTARLFDPNGTLEADLASATAVDVNVVRQAFALQRYQEARARYGSRYTEYLAYLGVRSSDARLQRPEYLGGGTQNLSFSEVLQTASTTAAGDGVGQLYGHGIGAMRSNRYRKFFEEHGYIMSMLHVLPETMYPQGLYRTWNRRVKEDFWQKELQHIGQQAILNKEIYALGGSLNDTFGYQDRYDEYRRQESRIHGEFFSSLNDWHFARLLSGLPTLNGSFVTSNPTKRPFQAQGENNTLLIQARHRIGARRMVAATGSSFIF